VRKIVQIAEDRAGGEKLIEPLDLLEAIRVEGAGMAADILARASRV
jgi:hypothetical protein